MQSCVYLTGVTLRRLVTSRQTVVSLLLLGFAVLAVIAWSLRRERTPDEFVNHIFLPVHISFLLPIFCLCYGAASISSDREEQTLVYLLVTPLQVARFVAAVGNGGTLYRPQVIEKIVNVSGETVYEFQADSTGTLPITDDTLNIIQGAMTEVIRNRRGTASDTFSQFPVALAGKTSTSETGVFDPDAWFVVYTMENREDKPDIAVVVMVEKVGEGADFAAPIARRVLEVYYFGSPRTIFSWEARIGVPEDLIPEEVEEGEEENGESGD